MINNLEPNQKTNALSLGSKKYELVIRHSETMGDNS
jgi:hypothetical protein